MCAFLPALEHKHVEAPGKGFGAGVPKCLKGFGREGLWQVLSVPMRIEKAHGTGHCHDCSN